MVGGYTNVDYRVRSRRWSALPRMEGNVVVITGATSGKRASGGGRLCQTRGTVWLAVCNRERGKDARARILEHLGQADVHVELCDRARLELTLATHVVGPFLLPRLLAPTLERSVPSRIVPCPRAACTPRSSSPTICRNE